MKKNLQKVHIMAIESLFGGTPRCTVNKDIFTICLHCTNPCIQKYRDQSRKEKVHRVLMFVNVSLPIDKDKDVEKIALYIDSESRFIGDSG